MAKINTFKLYIEYEGTRFHGWQVQRNIKTIQGTLFDAIKQAAGLDNFELYGSGRTDKGVHALEQIAHLRAPLYMPPDILRMKLNDLLPADICVKQIQKESEAFHARKSAVARSYVYQIAQRRTAFGKPFVWWVKDTLNVEKMQEAASFLAGTHDFVNLSDKDTGDESSIVKVYHAGIFVEGNMIMFRICAQHFLWKMVRKTVAALVEVGRSNISPAEFSKLLTKSRTSRKVEISAPPSGLFLEKVFYKQSEIVESIPRSFIPVD